MEAKNAPTQSRLSVEESPLEVKAKGVVLASRRGESEAVVDEVNIVNQVGRKFKFYVELSVFDVRVQTSPDRLYLSTSRVIAQALVTLGLWLTITVWDTGKLIVLPAACCQ